MDKLRSIAVAVLVTIALFGAVSQAAAEEYYKGKTITIVVPHGPGGGADRVSRLLAEYLPKHLPGSPRVVLRYMLGGQSLVASNWFYNSAPKDGTVIMTGSGVVAVNSLVKTQGVEYDTRDFPVIMAFPVGVITYANGGKVPSATEFFDRSKDLIYGGNPMPWTNTIHFELAKEVLGFEVANSIHGYDTGTGRTAFLSGEIDMTVEGVAHYAGSIMPLAEKGEVTPLWQSGITGESGKLERLSMISDVPTVREFYVQQFGKEPEGETEKVLNIFEWYSAYIRTFNKPIYLPPGAEDILAHLDGGVASMMSDPDFQAASEKILLGAQIYTGESAKKVRADILANSEEAIPWLRNWLSSEYGVKINE